MLSKQNKKILINRTKSFGWRLGAYIVVAFLNFGVSSLNLFSISSEVIVVIALIVGEITKYVNVNLKELKGLKETKVDTTDN